MTTDLAKELATDFSVTSLEQIAKGAQFRYDLLKQNAQSFAQDGELQESIDIMKNADTFRMLAHYCNEMIELQGVK